MNCRLNTTSSLIKTTGAHCQESASWTRGSWRSQGGSINNEKPKRGLLLCPARGRLIDREVATGIVNLQGEVHHRLQGNVVVTIVPGGSRGETCWYSASAVCASAARYSACVPGRFRRPPWLAAPAPLSGWNAQRFVNPEAGAPERPVMLALEPPYCDGLSHSARRC